MNNTNNNTVFEEGVDYGRLAFMRLDDLEAGVKVAEERPRFGSAKITSFSRTNIRDRTISLGALSGAGAVSFVAKLRLDNHAVSAGVLELRLNNMVASSESLMSRPAGIIDIVMVGSAILEDGSNLVALSCTGNATLIAAEVVTLGDGVIRSNDSGANYDFDDISTAIVMYSDNTMSLSILEGAVLRASIGLGFGRSADVARNPDGGFVVAYIDDQRNVWYALIAGNGLSELRWLGQGYDQIAIAATEDNPVVALVKDGQVYTAVVRHVLSGITRIDGARNVREVSFVKGALSPALIITGFGGRSTLRLGQPLYQINSGVLRGRVEYRD